MLCCKYIFQSSQNRQLRRFTLIVLKSKHWSFGARISGSRFRTGYGCDTGHIYLSLLNRISQIFTVFRVALAYVFVRVVRVCHGETKKIRFGGRTTA